ncbi:hypothetical protein H1P_670015 [Hyella patelloides LEGE 07179]|uniref:Uncharacterized protein n=1 Tax=Hyella patelloides LEGE 07179 TaxID=945734 RepID=A0A563W373_9CYAN|nr:hypothetical protein H1P_670015 [Hyella patelloides LEGE 07179]
MTGSAKGTVDDLLAIALTNNHQQKISVLFMGQFEDKLMYFKISHRL